MGVRMAYVDLARSHVKECLREAFELPQLIVDEDGDVPFHQGTAVYFVSIRLDGKKVKVWSQAVVGIKPTAGVLREVNEVNAGMEHARAFITRQRLVIEGVLPTDGLTPEDLRDLCLEVGVAADEIGTMISAVHGGEVARPGSTSGCAHCDSED